jgi:hypothetical protein
MNTASNFISPAIIFALTLVMGLWVTISGKPYNGLLFSIHKLAALGTVLLIVLRLIDMLKATHAQGVVIILLLCAAGICAMALFVSGALMSAGKMSYNLMLGIHRIAPVILTAAIAMVVYQVWRI